jgi:GTPase SAR1 family protein
MPKEEKNMQTNQSKRVASKNAIIHTEGKTDWMLLKKAFDKLNIKLNLSFFEFTEINVGDSNLLKKCETFAQNNNPQLMIFIFDRDNPEVVKKVTSEGRAYKNWGNNTFSFALPVPTHRIQFENLCIELYFSDDEIKADDTKRRRIFLTNEFNEISGNLIKEPTLHIGNKGKLKGCTSDKCAKIVDSEVYNTQNENVALSKSDFAMNICNDIPPFDQFSFNHFNQIFDIIQKIIFENTKQPSIYFPEFESTEIMAANGEVSAETFNMILKQLYGMIELTMELFTISTIRFYELSDLDKTAKYSNQVRFIKKEIKEHFKEPTFITLHRLTKLCFHAIDSNAPTELCQMKKLFEKEVTLEAIGNLLDEIEKILPPDKLKPKILNRPQLRKEILGYLIPELEKFYGKVQELTEKLEVNEQNIIATLNIVHWENALKKLSEILSPILDTKYIFRTLSRVDTAKEKYYINVKTYTKNKIEITEEITSLETFEEFRQNVTETEFSYDNRSVNIDLFPFLMIKDDKLYYYKRTRAAGYEYYSLVDGSVCFFNTKKKFSQCVFKQDKIIGQQASFWTEVLPTKNENNGIKANIPIQGLGEFVGRKKQIKKIIEEIIEIPNQNGFIYGPGGVGKTALMVQLSKQLYSESIREKIYFSNIIWVSAKTNYYEESSDTIEQHELQFQSLDNIFSVILRFFEYEEVDDYIFEEKKELVLELLESKKILLILDNFETIAAISTEEAIKIIKFFQTEVKQRLRKKPEYFKVIVTSRKLVPNGFHQIDLVGLDLTESKQLMNNMFQKYRDARDELTEEQKTEIHNVTHGIPIVIKHCFGQIFSFNRPFLEVIRNLPKQSNKVIEFSFAEIFRLLKKDELQLKIILLLETINCSLLIRQISDILEIEEYEIELRIPDLTNFQCIERINEGLEEKYLINEKVSLLTKSLVQQHSETVESIRQKVTNNFTLDKRMDYSAEELTILRIFEDYLNTKLYFEGEKFIKEALEKKPTSVLLKLHYAKYLKERKNDAATAISILENIIEANIDNINILGLYLSCNMNLDNPPFDHLHRYILKLKTIISPNDDDARLEICEFYVQWSLSLKIKREIDPLKEMTRQQRYKDFATNAIAILNQIKNKTHRVYYLYAEAYFIKWNYEEALKMIENALEIIQKDPSFYSMYSYLQRLILAKKHQYSRRVY